MKTILSIDGGGIRGIIPLACLASLEILEGKPSREIIRYGRRDIHRGHHRRRNTLGLDAGRILALYRDLAREALRHPSLVEDPPQPGKLSLQQRVYGPDDQFDRRGCAAQQSADRHPDHRQEHRDQPHRLLRPRQPGQRLPMGNDAATRRQSWPASPCRPISRRTRPPSAGNPIPGSTGAWASPGTRVPTRPSKRSTTRQVFTPRARRACCRSGRAAPHTGSNAPRASILDWARWVLAELLEDAADWQTYVQPSAYGESGRIDFRRYQLDLTPGGDPRAGRGDPARSRHRQDRDRFRLGGPSSLEEIGRRCGTKSTSPPLGVSKSAGRRDRDGAAACLSPEWGERRCAGHVIGRARGMFSAGGLIPHGRVCCAGSSRSSPTPPP